MKKIHQATIIGQQGINLIEQIVLAMGCVWNPTHLDSGIDGHIELRDAATGEVTNNIIQVQSKATELPFEADNGSTFEYICSEKDLQYWLGGNAPVILVRSCPKTREAYWISVKDYFNRPNVQKSRKIVFDKKHDRLDIASKDALFRLATPTNRGLYLGAIPKKEQLFSNLLRLAPLPKSYFVADTIYRTGGELHAALREMTDMPPGEWVLNNKRVWSFHDLSDFPWDKLSDPGTMDELPTEEWSQTEDASDLRLFVRLLNACLRNKLYEKGVTFSNENGYFFFRATPDLRDKEHYYQGREHRTSRFVFKGYSKKKDPAQMAYYRHSAFDGRFVRYGGTWFLQITPTYHYTFDGWRPYYWAADQLSGIKRLENNDAVLGQVIMWQDILRERVLFDKIPRFLEFASLADFELDAGFEDASWLDREEPQRLGELVTDEDAQKRLL